MSDDCVHGGRVERIGNDAFGPACLRAARPDSELVSPTAS